MNGILFIAKYPTETDLKDGMMQRIKAIDDEFDNKKRTYLTLSRRANFIIRKEQPTQNLTIFRLNVFLHFWFVIIQIAKHTNIYIHSLHNFYLVRNFSNFKKKTICLDVHGSVPEELEFYGHKRVANKMQKAEKKLFSVLSHLIVVSEQMAQFYKQKYPQIVNKHITVKPIFSTNVMRNVTEKDQKNLQRKLGISDQQTVLIYSGNLQKWQNFDLMVDVIVQHLKPSYHIIILTGEIDKACEVINNRIPQNQLTLQSVSPVQLAEYYAIANYGFILRDEHTLNKVAAPTKLVEYLFYGIVPIVKYSQIGDAALMNYDYIDVDSLASQDLQKIKSNKNMEIAKHICEQNEKNPVFNIFD